MCAEWTRTFRLLDSKGVPTETLEAYKRCWRVDDKPTFWFGTFENITSFIDMLMHMGYYPRDSVIFAKMLILYQRIAYARAIGADDTKKDIHRKLVGQHPKYKSWPDMDGLALEWDRFSLSDGTMRISRGTPKTTKGQGRPKQGGKSPRNQPTTTAPTIIKKPVRKPAERVERDDISREEQRRVKKSASKNKEKSKGKGKGKERMKGKGKEQEREGEEETEDDEDEDESQVEPTAPSTSKSKHTGKERKRRLFKRQRVEEEVEEQPMPKSAGKGKAKDAGERRENTPDPTPDYRMADNPSSTPSRPGPTNDDPETGSVGNPMASQPAQRPLPPKEPTEQSGEASDKPRSPSVTPDDGTVHGINNPPASTPPNNAQSGPGVPSTEDITMKEPDMSSMDPTEISRRLLHGNM